MNTSNSVRQATTADIPQVEMLMKSEPGFWHQEWREDVLQRALVAADDLALVWEQAGEIEGFVCAHDVGFLGYLSILVVSENVRGQGIGRKLVSEVEQRLAARGCAVLISDVWKDAVGFYQSLGWRPPDVVLMRKLLLNQ
jgi:GNAT superfamily N-acetyltransferase